MAEYNIELEKKLNKRSKKSKNTLEEDSFIDFEMIYSFFISAIVHIIVLVSIWLLIINIYNDVYSNALSKTNSKYPKDIIFNLKRLPENTKDFSQKEFFNEK